MIRNPSKSGAVNKEFIDRVKPMMESWGLSKHPNPTSYFGRSDHGFRYDFADLQNKDDIKIAAFAILNPGPSLWIKGLREKHKYNNNSDVPMIFDSMNDVFTLTRRFFILRPMNVIFEFNKKRKESNEEAASHLIGIVVSEIHKLREYLYR